MTRPCLVLLPGLLCDESVWAAQQEALSGVDCRVPGYALLDSIAVMAQSVLHSLPAGRFSLAGHSMGGRIALEIARRAPERVERLAILDSGTDPIAPGEAGERERQQRFGLLEVARTRGMREMGRQWARGMVHPARLDTPLFARILDMIERKTPAEFEAQIHALLGRPDARAALAALRCPTWFIVGRQDAWSPLSRHQRMHEAVPGSRLVVVEESGHMAPMEQPETVSDALLQWMKT